MLSTYVELDTILTETRNFLVTHQAPAALRLQLAALQARLDRERYKGIVNPFLITIVDAVTGREYQIPASITPTDTKVTPALATALDITFEAVKEIITRDDPDRVLNPDDLHWAGIKSPEPAKPWSVYGNNITIEDFDIASVEASTPIDATIQGKIAFLKIALLENALPSHPWSVPYQKIEEVLQHFFDTTIYDVREETTTIDQIAGAAERLLDAAAPAPGSDGTHYIVPARHIQVLRESIASRTDRPNRQSGKPSNQPMAAEPASPARYQPPADPAVTPVLQVSTSPVTSPETTSHPHPRTEAPQEPPAFTRTAGVRFDNEEDYPDTIPLDADRTESRQPAEPPAFRPHASAAPQRPAPGSAEQTTTYETPQEITRRNLDAAFKHAEATTSYRPAHPASTVPASPHEAPSDYESDEVEDLRKLVSQARHT